MSSETATRTCQIFLMPSSAQESGSLSANKYPSNTALMSSWLYLESSLSNPNSILGFISQGEVYIGVPWPLFPLLVENAFCILWQILCILWQISLFFSAIDFLNKILVGRLLNLAFFFFFYSELKYCWRKKNQTLSELRESKEGTTFSAGVFPLMW